MYVQGSSYAKGGAVYNNASTIGNINGNFVNNYAESLKSTAYGGAIPVIPLRQSAISTVILFIIMRKEDLPTAVLFITLPEL